MAVGRRRGWGLRGRSRISNDMGGVMKEALSVYVGAPVDCRTQFNGECCLVAQMSGKGPQQQPVSAGRCARGSLCAGDMVL